MTTTRNHPGPAGHAATGGRGITARIRACGGRLSDRMHAADARAGALGWEVTQTSGWPGVTGRSYRDPRFGAPAGRQRGATARWAR